jgi:glycosyltransferase involved in cell wall biosynthesis
LDSAPALFIRKEEKGLRLELMDLSERFMVNSKPYQKPAVHLVTMRMKGHAGPSGYDRIIDYVDAVTIAPQQKLSLPSRIIARLARNVIANAGMQWYHREEFICEMQAAMRWLKTSGGLFHFIYGENSYRYLSVIKRWFPKNKIVCTFHTPAERFESLLSKKEHLQAIDAVVVVSNSQKPYFSNLLNRDNVYFIPHGVDTDVFKPVSKRFRSNGRFNCIFVGKHLRDISSMQKTVAAAEKRNPDIHFHLVSDQASLSLFDGHGNVSTYHRISDEKLISLYQEADALTLPLLESTANNSILEAVACGLPVITTDLIGTRDYLNDDCAIFIPRGDSEAYVTHIENLMGHAEICDQMAKASRKKAEELSWTAVAAAFEKLYSKINQL